MDDNEQMGADGEPHEGRLDKATRLDAHPPTHEGRMDKATRLDAHAPTSMGGMPKTTLPDRRHAGGLDKATRPGLAWEELSQGERSSEGPGEAIVGQLIDGRYEVRSLIGAGGMGFVYLAYHARMQREVVLKTLRPELVSNERTRERFVREAQSLSRVQHPHIIKVHDYGVSADHGAYYVMERLVGLDLAAEMAQRREALPLDRAFHITRQVTSALASAHAAQVVHRDLKPENIFLVEQNGVPDYVKVLDFGLARLMDANRKLTETGQVIGTPRYMAPEQCRGEKVDARADVYSLALILYQMVTGQQPYETLSTYEILGKKMFEDIPPPSRLNPPRELPAAVETLLVRCLDREPQNRPADAAHLGEALRQVVDELGLDPGPFAPRVSAAPIDPWPEVTETSDGGDVPASALDAVPSPPLPAQEKKPPRAKGLLIGIGMAALVFLLGIPALIIGLTYTTTSDDDAPTETTEVAETVTPVDDESSITVTEEPPPDPSEQTWVTVMSAPEGAEVWMDETMLGTTPLTLTRDMDLADGTEVEVRLAGYQTRGITLFSDVPEPTVRLQPEEDDP